MLLGSLDIAVVGELEEGFILRRKVGLMVLGDVVGATDGFVGDVDGVTVGPLVGILVGRVVGTKDCNTVGDVEGVREVGGNVIGQVGSAVGVSLGIAVKIAVGLDEGDCVKTMVHPAAPAFSKAELPNCGL